MLQAVFLCAMVGVFEASAVAVSEVPNSCAATKCQAGQVCVMQEVQCIRAPCFPVPECVQAVPVEKPGQCPAEAPGSVGICAFTCSSDGDCKGDTKCCRTPCGGTTCQSPAVEQRPSCNTVKCSAGYTCVMELPADCIFRKPCFEEPKCVPIEMPCYYDDQQYPAGDFRLPGNPCAFCQCDGSTGQASCAFMKCARPACDNPIYVPEECCPMCPGPGEVCYFRGRFYPVGPLRDLDSPCEHCTCHSDGKVTCAIQDCARPPCEEPVRMPGQCCPTCLTDLYAELA